MLKVILLLLGVLSPLSLTSDAQPSSPSKIGQPAVAHAIYRSFVRTGDHPVANLDMFQTLNGISLTDTKQEVVAKMGEPLQIASGMVPDCSDYHYKEATVGICDGVVDYVHVSQSARRMQINDTWIPLNLEEIHRYLGQPQFIADDGIVYIRGHHAIKVYWNPQTKELDGADLFDQATE